MNQKLQNAYVKIKKSWIESNRSERLYAIAGGLILIWVIGQFFKPGALLNQYLMFVAYGIYGFAFATWIFSYKSYLKSESANILLKVLHAFVAVMAIVFGRFIVFTALEFPPQYFEVTVSLVALISYVPLYLLLIAAFLFVFYVVALIAGSFISFIESFLQQIFIFFRWHGVKNAPFFVEIRQFRKKAFMHAIGSAALALISAGLASWIFSSIESTSNVIRQFAYYADFQPAGNYPGVPCNARIRIQDNGVVAVARKTQDGIRIEKAFYAEGKLGAGCSN
ncbi:hypothetical protein Undi14_07965 [Undibacterium sp. 14-3-2]|uniref:hypothetical protein n=1 Tax=Undibacterium sp. 14-3-2 TaxID=2800129 RepID=UPI00190671AE|nr:hypothetical protein [Undibacterium sp. 14-3-2]MBK1889971.1 hypothetical protein [Undibacterium sp. 14-3-2]